MKINFIFILFMISSAGFSMVKNQEPSREQKRIIKIIEDYIKKTRTCTAIDKTRGFSIEPNTLYDDPSERLWNHIDGKIFLQNTRFNKSVATIGVQITSTQNISYHVELSKFISRKMNKNLEEFASGLKIWKIKTTCFFPCYKTQNLVYVDKIGKYKQDKTETEEELAPNPTTPSSSNVNSPVLAGSEEPSDDLLKFALEELEQLNNMDRDPAICHDAPALTNRDNINAIIAKINELRKSPHGENTSEIYPGLLIRITDPTWITRFWASLSQHIIISETINATGNLPNLYGIASPSLLTGYTSLNNHTTPYKVKFWVLTINNEKYYYIEECSYEGTPVVWQLG